MTVWMIPIETAPTTAPLSEVEAAEHGSGEGGEGDQAHVRVDPERG